MIGRIFGLLVRKSSPGEHLSRAHLSFHEYVLFLELRPDQAGKYRESIL